ncbi:MAG TPA: capsular biosynthesis protein, partial [Ferruginibacter sp.]|nr:capsular biosynthesis protein [Ferruginibacter sp.]
NLYTAEFELDAAKAAGGDKSTAVILGEEKVADIKKDINENIRNIRNSFEAEKRSINNSINLNNSLLKDVPTKELALLDISRQQSIKDNIYTFLLQKREETALSSASSTSDLRVLENAS